MKILHRFMLKQFAGPFIGAFFIVIIALVMQSMWKYIDDLVGKGLPVMVIGELLFWTSLWLSNMAFPLAVLLASIFTLGSMGENYELIALKASGISLQRILFPLIVLSTGISIGAFFFANNVVPYAFLEWRTLVYDIQQQRPELKIQEGVFYNGIDGYSIRIGSRNYKTAMLYDLRIHDHTAGTGNVQVTLADSGQMVTTADKGFLEVELFHGHSYTDLVESRRSARQNKNRPFRHDYFDRELFRLALPNYGLERSDVEIFKSGAQMMNLPQLTTMIDSFSLLIHTQENQLRTLEKPAYNPPEPATPLPVDTALRAKIPDNFRDHFNQQTKAKRQVALQAAVNSVRSRKDQVAGLIYELSDKNKRIWLYEVEWHRKYTVAIACFVFFFIGAPLGAIIRKGGLGTPVIIAVLFFVIYYVISMVGEKSAKGGAMTPLEGMWISAAVILAVGVFLTWMATRDSSIFNPEVYVNWIKKGLGYIFITNRNKRPETDYCVVPADLMPNSMINRLEELQRHCKSYLEGDFRQNAGFGRIWYQHENPALTEIGRQYDDLCIILKQADIDMIRETVTEYPVALLHNYKIKQQSPVAMVIIAAIFPVWFYLALKVSIQKNSLRNELRNIMGANQNLLNELYSIL